MMDGENEEHTYLDGVNGDQENPWPMLVAFIALPAPPPKICPSGRVYVKIYCSCGQLPSTTWPIICTNKRDSIARSSSRPSPPIHHQQTHSLLEKNSIPRLIKLGQSLLPHGSSPLLLAHQNLSVLVWYGHWSRSRKLLIKDFLLSVSTPPPPKHKPNAPPVYKWWSTVSLYTDQTGANVVAGEYADIAYSHGKHLTRPPSSTSSLPPSSPPPSPSTTRTVYTSSSPPTMSRFGTFVEQFAGSTTSSPFLGRYTLPYAWIGNSAKQCPEVCAYSFAIPGYMGGRGPGALKSPNGDLGVDGMISVIGHELAELLTNPLVNAWYAGEDPTAPTEIADLCEGLYGKGGGGGYFEQVMRDRQGRTFSMVGSRGRRFSSGFGIPF